MVKNLVVTAENMFLPIKRHYYSVARDWRRETLSKILEALLRLANLRSIEYIILSILFIRTLI